MDFAVMSISLKLRHFLLVLGQIDGCIGFYVKFYMKKGLFGPLGDVSTSSKRPPKVRAVHYFLPNLRVFKKTISTQRGKMVRVKSLFRSQCLEPPLKSIER